MSFNQTFDFTGFTGFDNNNLGYDNSNTVDEIISAFNWENNTGLDLYTHQYADAGTNEGWYLHPSTAGGPGQPYTGVEVFGGLSGSSYLDYPTTAPATLYPDNGVSYDEGKSSCQP